MIAPKWPVSSSVPLQSVIADDVDGGGFLRLLRRRVRKQSMHKVNGLVFHPRGPSLYTENGRLHIGQGDRSDGLVLTREG